MPDPTRIAMADEAVNARFVVIVDLLRSVADSMVNVLGNVDGDRSLIATAMAVLAGDYIGDRVSPAERGALLEQLELQMAGAMHRAAEWRDRRNADSITTGRPTRARRRRAHEPDRT